MSHLESQAVVVMYPDRRTTGDVDPRIRSYSSWYQRIKTITDSRLSHYVAVHQLPIIGITYDDTFPDNISPFFAIEKFTQLEPIGRSLDQWKNDEHMHLLEKLISQLSFNTDKSIIVTGFHLDSCVLDMELVLQSRGYDVRTDPLLTEYLSSIVADNEVHRIQKKSGFVLPDEVGLINYLREQHQRKRTARLNEVG